MSRELAEMTVTEIAIQGTFDIAQGRRTLRTELVRRQWDPGVQARATVALTALGELILLLGRGKMSVVKMNFFEYQQGDTLEFSFEVPPPNADFQRFETLVNNLEHVTDDLVIDHTTTKIRLMARLRAN